MPSTHAERVTPAQSTALTLEDLGLGMHSGLLMLYGHGPAEPEETLDIEHIQQVVERALSGVPYGRQRVRRIPVEGHWVWTDDQRFNLHYHIRHSALPRPGDERQLKRLVGRLMSERLDRNRPLWEVWVIEGVAHARFALVLKLHEGVLEGAAIPALLASIADLDAAAELGASPEWRPRPAPATSELLADAAAYWGRKPREMLEHTLAVLGHAQEALRSPTHVPSAWAEVMREAVGARPRTVLNPRRIGAHRRVDTLDLPTSECEQIAAALSAPIADVALAALAGGLECFLRERGDKVEALEIETLVSLPRELGAASAQTTVLRVALPVRISDPVERVIEVARARLAAESGPRAIAHDFLGRLESWIPPGIQRATQTTGFRGRANLGIHFIDATSPLPALLDVQLRSVALFAPLRMDQGLSVGIVRSASGLSLGFNSDWDLFPDLHMLVEATARSFAQLHARIGSGWSERRHT